jgi:hypothetical protein
MDAQDGDAPDTPDDASDVNDASDAPDRAPCNRPEVPFDQLPTAVTGLTLWLDPEIGVSLTPTLRWSDRSPVHADATATGAATPSFVPAADCALPAFEFSGAGQFLTLPDGMQDVSHIFVVAEPRAALAAPSDASTPFSDLMPLVHFSNGSRINEIRYEVNAYQILYASFPSNSSPYMVNPVGVANNYTGQMQLFEVRIPNQIPDNPISVAHFKNGLSLGTAGAISSANTVMRMRSFIGHTGIAGEPDFHGRVGEVLVYSHALLDAERTKVVDYLLAKWNLR